MDQLLGILKNIRGDVDFINEKALVDKRVLDSFDIISIVGEINTAFGVRIDVVDLTPANFNSLESISALVNRLMEE